MKFKILLLLFISFQSYSQISVGPIHVGRAKKFKKGVLKKFKNTETIFVLSKLYDKKEYEKILKESWDVTPYKVVDIEDFNLEDYLKGNYSFARLVGFTRTTEMRSLPTNKIELNSTTLYTYIDVSMYDSEKIFKRLNKLSPKRRKKKKEKIIDENELKIARFYLFPKAEFIQKTLSEDDKKIAVALYSEDVFYNYKPGLLKNYFQKINNLIKNEEGYWMYKKEYLPELKELAKRKLYIPAYLGIKYDAWKANDKKKNEDYFKQIFKDYDYQYEKISDEDLSNRILDNQDFYYLRFVRMNSEKFVQVVNSKTGEIIYRDYIPGFSYNLKSKHIKNLNKKIKKALKK